MAAKRKRSAATEPGAMALPDRMSQVARSAGGWARRLAEAASQLPGAEQAQAQFRRAEQRVLLELKNRIDAAAAQPPPAGRRGDDGVSRTYVIPLLQSPKKLLQELLERSVHQTREGAYEDFYSVLLSELVPDEARLLALMSDGSRHAVLHIGIGAPIGPVRQRVAENYSSIGRPAQVKAQELVPLYLTHLKALGLIEEGPEDPALEAKYQIIEGLRDVRDAAEAARRSTRTASVRLLRRTLQMSALGQQLWAACTDPSAEAETPRFVLTNQS